MGFIHSYNVWATWNTGIQQSDSYHGMTRYAVRVSIANGIDGLVVL